MKPYTIRMNRGDETFLYEFDDLSEARTSFNFLVSTYVILYPEGRLTLILWDRHARKVIQRVLSDIL